jgi:hypothetical protein
MPAGEDEVVSAFREAAEAFRSALANDEHERREFARRVRNAVARVYLAAASLPRGGGLGTATIDRGYNRTLEARIRARFGDAALAQELAEIDGELERSVAWLEEPREPDALSGVWSAFEQHWGSCAVDALPPLHRIARA